MPLDEEEKPLVLDPKNMYWAIGDSTLALAIDCIISFVILGIVAVGSEWIARKYVYTTAGAQVAASKELPGNRHTDDRQ